MSKKDEALKLALEHAKRDERHLNHAETRYWCRMYRDIAEKAIEALAEQHEMTNIERHERNVQKFLAEQPAQRKPLTDEEERKAFVDWCFSVGLMAQSHGLRSESSDCDTAWKAWKARAAHGIKGDA